MVAVADQDDILMVPEWFVGSFDYRLEFLADVNNSVDDGLSINIRVDDPEMFIQL
jgi:hypothetical protein